MESKCGNHFLIMPGSCSYNWCVLFFDLVDLHALVSELKISMFFFFNLKNTNGLFVHFNMFSCTLSRLKIFRRCPEIFKDFDSSSKVRYF